MAIDAAGLISKARGFFTEATDNVLVIYAEKGIEPFKKPLMIAFPVLLVLFAGVYRPLGGKIEEANYQLEVSQAISEGAGDYQAVKEQLLAAQSRLPLLKDKDEWLSYLLMNSAKAHGISFDMLSAQTEEDAGSFLVVSRRVEFVTDYSTLGRWLAEVENSPIFIRVVSLEVAREEMNPLRLKVSVKLSTVFMKPEGATSGGAAGGAPAGVPGGGV